MVNKANNNPPVRILTSGKVVGNPAEQWKEVKDNRVKVVNSCNDVQNTNGKEIVPADMGRRKVTTS